MVDGEVSLATDGDLNSQCAKSAFPSYSRMDFADIVVYDKIFRRCRLKENYEVFQKNSKGER